MAASANPVETDSRFVKLRKRSFFAFATAKIFQRRARKYRKLVQWLTFLGLVIPLAVGGIVLGNVLKSGQLERVLPVAGLLGLIQVVLSGWSVVANWPESLEYSSTAASANFDLWARMDALAEQEAKPPGDFDVRATELETLDRDRNDLDNRRDITSGEQRFGHREALIQFGWICQGCKKKPTSMRMRLLPWHKCWVCGGKRDGEIEKEHGNTGAA